MILNILSILGLVMFLWSFPLYLAYTRKIWLGTGTSVWHYRRSVLYLVISLILMFSRFIPW